MWKKMIDISVKLVLSSLLIIPALFLVTTTKGSNLSV